MMGDEELEMNNKYKLTIALITMNRAEQMKNAVQSCFASDLPKDTQFVIVDNGSVDDTAAVIDSLKKESPYDLIYQKEEVNRGASVGRNICFDLAEGEYVYFLDDDGEIAPECQKTFFVKSISFMDENPSVASLTTEVVDHVFGERPCVLAKTDKVGDLRCTYTFHEGTVFFRKSIFPSPLFLDIIYGREGLVPSTMAMDRGYYNVFDPSIFINHYPKMNKWDGDSLNRINVSTIQNVYNIKRLLYPSIFTPVLYMAYKTRLKKYAKENMGLIKDVAKKGKEFVKNTKVKKVKVTTVIKCYKEYGLTTF
jgi:glycosyltransferase involved in cell wall biosynthesis